MPARTLRPRLRLLVSLLLPLALVLAGCDGGDGADSSSGEGGPGAEAPGAGDSGEPEGTRATIGPAPTDGDEETAGGEDTADTGDDATGGDATGGEDTADTGDDSTGGADTGSTPRPDPLVPQGRPGDPVSRSGSRTTESGIEWARLAPGEGEPPPAGAEVALHLTGWVRRGDQLGQEFWDTRDDGATHSYVLTEATLIPGLVEMLREMRRGERRWVVIPASLAYGPRGYGQLVGPGKDLVLDVQLVSWKAP